MNDVDSTRHERPQIVKTVRRFVNEAVAPVAAELDRAVDPEDSLSWEIVEKADKVGIRTLTLAEEYGGIGADSLTTAIVIEKLAKGGDQNPRVAWRLRVYARSGDRKAGA